MATEDVGRFEQMVVPHLDDAYTLARYLLHDEHDAQDAVQEAVLRALRYFDGFRSDDARAWLLTIVRNYCYTWHQSHIIDRASVPLSDAEPMTVSDSRGADDRAIEASERDRVQAAVAQLPAELREVIVLRELNDMSYREISEIAGVPMGTVMSRLSRARSRLAELLAVNSVKAG